MILEQVNKYGTKNAFAAYNGEGQEMSGQQAQAYDADTSQKYRVWKGG